MYQKVESWFDIVALEKNIQSFWEENQVFEKLVKKNQSGKEWSFIDGPITANNPMGVHHAWGRTLKDLYQRYWAMNGRKLRWQNGFDCQGLWVEVEVEKELGFSSKREIEAYGIDRFVEKCKQRVMKYAEVITRQSKRLGYWMDWENSYYTMSPENNYTIWGFLKKCFKKGLIYKGHDVMPWCPRCGTAISQHEMQEGYKETTHRSVVVRFPLAGRDHEALLVWTTTPWTLTSNVAVAVKPEATYVKVRQSGWNYYLLKSRAEVVLKGQGTWEVLEELTGKELLAKHFSYTGPFDELPTQKMLSYRHKLIPWKDITEEEGTGLVHIAPGCGAEDFLLGKEFGLAVIAPIDDAGLFTEGFDWLLGRHASDVAEDIFQNLQQKGVFYSSEPYKHSYAHCWRCDTELLFRLIDEWFVRMDPWREEIKHTARQIHWIPAFGLDLELDWLENMRDWMISKKRYWGLALPIWECRDCREFTLIGGYEELRSKAVEGWELFEGHGPHRPWIDYVKIACPNCGKPASRVPDVGNPWLDAGIVTYSTLNYNIDKSYWQRWVPADLILECFPGQYRHWFYSLITMSTMMENLPPCKTILGHAPVRDENGQEMHKSKGNAIWFDDAAESMGADVMRWIYCTQELTSNLNFGYGKAKLVRGKFFNMLWNCYAFFVNYARLIGFVPPDQPSEAQQRPDFDRWILSELQYLVQRCRKGFETYDVRSACRAIDAFLELLSNWYIRNNRRRYWRSDLDEDTRQAYETLYTCLETTLRLLAPMIPMTTEACYQNLVRSIKSCAEESVHLTDYPVADNTLMDEQLVEDMDVVIKVYKAALSAREKARVKIRQPLPRLLITANDESEKHAVIRFAEVLKDALNVKQIQLLDLGTSCPVEFRVRPNRQALGRAYRTKSRSIVEQIEARQDLIADGLKRNQREFELEVQGEIVTISIDDLLIEEGVPQHLSIAKLDGGWLAVETVLTEELLIEGLMRDFLRQMQVLRKDLGLEIEDRITIEYATDSIDLKRAVETFREFLCHELLCGDLREAKMIVEGRPIHIAGQSIFVNVGKVRLN